MEGKVSSDPWRQLLREGVVLKFLAFGVIVFFSGNETTAAQAIAERAYAHLAIRITGPTLIQSGDQVTIAVVLNNPTSFPIRIAIDPGSAGFDNKFSVMGPHGLAALTSYGMALEGKSDQASNFAAGARTVTQHSVLPGEDFQQYSAVSDIFDMTAPGKYVIAARRYLRDGTIFKSNKIIVTVTK
jgi:hypothetical protein